MPEIINLNVVLLPSEKTSQKAIELSRIIGEEFETFFTLNSENCIPHISFYHAAYPGKNVSQIKDAITSITKEIKSFPIELKTVFWHKEGWLDFQAVKSGPLISLHNLVVNKLNPLREGNLMESDRKDSSSYLAEEQEMLRLYGYRHAMDLFRPHLTITRLKTGDVAKVAGKLEGNDLSFEADIVALCQLGDYGTCIDILGKWDLK